MISGLMVGIWTIAPERIAPRQVAPRQSPPKKNSPRQSPPDTFAPREKAPQIDALPRQSPPDKSPLTIFQYFYLGSHTTSSIKCQIKGVREVLLFGKNDPLSVIWPLPPADWSIELEFNLQKIFLNLCRIKEYFAPPPRRYIWPPSPCLLIFKNFGSRNYLTPHYFILHSIMD